MSVRAMAAVWECSELKGMDKLVLLAWADHADHNGEKVFPRIDTIAKKTSLSRRGVQKITARLVEDGYLVMVEEGGGRGRTNVYSIPIDPKTGTLFTLSESETLEASRDKASEPAPGKPGTSFTLSKKGEPGDVKGEPRDVKGERGTIKGEPRSPDPSVTIKNHQEPPERAREAREGSAGKRSPRPEIPEALVEAIPDFEELWLERMKTPGRKRPTRAAEATQLELLVEVLRDHGPGPVLEAVKVATRGGYQNIFPEKHVRSGGGRSDAEMEERSLTPYERELRRQNAAYLRAQAGGST